MKSMRSVFTLYLLCFVLALNACQSFHKSRMKPDESLAVIVQQEGQEENIEEPKLVGEVSVKFLLWQVSTTQLFTQSGLFNPKNPLEYGSYILRTQSYVSLPRGLLVKRLMRAFRKKGLQDETKARLYEERLNGFLPNIKAGDILSIVHTKNNQLIFYLNEKKLDTIKEKDFVARLSALLLETKNERAHQELFNQPAQAF